MNILQVSDYSSNKNTIQIWHCCELLHRLQMQLGSGVVVAVVKAGGYSSNWTPSLGTSICCRCGPKNTIIINK